MHFVCLCERNESFFMALFNSKSSVQMMESVMKSLRSSSPEVPSLYWMEEPLHPHLHNCHRQNHCLGLWYHFQWGYHLYCCQIEKKYRIRYKILVCSTYLCRLSEQSNSAATFRMNTPLFLWLGFTNFVLETHSEPQRNREPSLIDLNCCNIILVFSLAKHVRHDLSLKSCQTCKIFRKIFHKISDIGPS